jgi:hypothetical protein
MGPNPPALLSNRWIYTDVDPGTGNPPGFVEHYTFNTPVNAAPMNQCGRVLYSDFHVSNAASFGSTFPGECDNSALTAQEQIIEFMLFDLASCIQPSGPPPMCTGRRDSAAAVPGKRFQKNVKATGSILET